MKNYIMLCVAALLFLLAAFISGNYFLMNRNYDNEGRPYIVEVERLAAEIGENGEESVELSQCSYVTNIEKITDKSSYFVNEDYAIREINGQLYRFDYVYTPDYDDSVVVMNVVLAVFSVGLAAFLLYIGIHIIAPFEKIKNTPAELAKGNLSVSLKDRGSGYFGSFIWGLDLLREKLEKDRENELRMQKDKKTLVLSLSHDLKTPLGVIELYAKALERDLYKDEQKKKEVAAHINEKCTEMKGYINEIVKASNDDFLNFDVREGEFYLSELVGRINTLYSEKLALIKTEFSVGQYRDRILVGDIDRAEEVIQNIIENAIKYGDGRKVELSFDEEEYCLLFSVKNSGSEISENELVHIFDSFWRGSNVGSVGGSGLGLYICRQLMHRMNGDIFAEYKNTGMCVTAVFSEV